MVSTNRRSFLKILAVVPAVVALPALATSKPISDLDKVKRLLDKLREDLSERSHQYIFEPNHSSNDHLTRSGLQNDIDAYLDGIRRRGMIHDYTVVCDQSNNRPATIDNNELWVDIAIKPKQTVEFIYMPIRIISSGSSIGSWL